MGPIYLASLSVSFTAFFIISHCQESPVNTSVGRIEKEKVWSKEEVKEENGSLDAKRTTHREKSSSAIQRNEDEWKKRTEEKPPGFEVSEAGKWNSTKKMTAYVGGRIVLDCEGASSVPISERQTVIWTRKRRGEKIRRITSGFENLIDDNRFSVKFMGGGWKLEIRDAQWSDRGQYECRIKADSRREKVITTIRLDLVTPFVEMIDGKGSKVPDSKEGGMTLKTGSTLVLICVVKRAHTFVIWTHDNHVLNFDSSFPARISIKTEMSSSIGMSKLRIKNVSVEDSGNYTCSLGNVVSSSVAVEVLKEKINVENLVVDEDYAVEIPEYVNDSPHEESHSSSSVWSYSTLSESRRSAHGGRSDAHELTPYFKDLVNSTNITAQLGSTAYLDCKINRLRDKTVSWMRRDGDAIKLLTFGLNTYSNDERYSLNFEHPNNWKLQIKYTQRRDQGTYECQISTHPPKVLLVNLNIVAPVVEIIDERGTNVKDKFYKTGSTIELRCTISQMPQAQTFILWRHGEHMLNYDTSRGGISVKTDMSSSVIVSTLFIANATPADSGNYTCSLGDVASGTVAVHVLNGGSGQPSEEWREGEHPAAMQLGCGNNDLVSFYMVMLPMLTAGLSQQVFFVR